MSGNCSAPHPGEVTSALLITLHVADVQVLYILISSDVHKKVSETE